MKKLILLFLLSAFVLAAYAQSHTVENIRIVQDGDNLKITYRIGASTETQLFKVTMTCSMDGGRRFEPKAVIGDVGENIIGGKSYYTIVWDVFEDVEEVTDPEFFFLVDLMSDMAADATPAEAEVTRSQDPPAQETPVNEPRQEPVREEEQPTGTSQTNAFEPSFEAEKSTEDVFARNGFFGYRGSPFIPIGISFGSLNNWGYYVAFRTGVSRTYNDYWEDYDYDFDLMAMAGATKYIIAAGFYRLHVYGGIGSHLSMDDSGPLEPFFLMDTGVINVLGRFHLALGFSVSVQHTYPTNLVFGAGFVF